MAMRVEGLDVRVYTKGHFSSLKGTPGDFLSPVGAPLIIEPCTGRDRAVIDVRVDTPGILEAPLGVTRVYSPRRSIGQSEQNIEQNC
jgi:hypothetical protein